MDCFTDQNEQGVQALTAQLDETMKQKEQLESDFKAELNESREKLADYELRMNKNLNVEDQGLRERIRVLEEEGKQAQLEFHNLTQEKQSATKVLEDINYKFNASLIELELYKINMKQLKGKWFFKNNKHN